MIPSPCINVCRIDGDSGLCAGCYRTLDEITVWAKLDNRDRSAMLALLAERRKQFPQLQEPRR